MEKYLKVLQKTTLFEGLNRDEILAVLQCSSARMASYQKEECVFMQGDPLSQVGIVVSGKARIQREDFHGNTIILTGLEAGDLFGEAFVCAGIPKVSVSLWAVTPLEVVFVDYQKAISPCSSSCPFHQKLVANMLKLMAQRLLMLNEKIDIIQKTTIRAKLMAFFELRMRQEGGRHFTVPFNRNELAEYIGVNRSAMSRELWNMKADGLIDFAKNQFTVLE